MSATETLRHYEVLSPELYFPGSDMEPPEYGRCWAMVETNSAKAAVTLAVKLPEFKEWVSQARSDGTNPFKGVKAKRAVCEHGHCWGCSDCERCIAESEAA